jgi:GNAT superfamily N-acetyltransferase
MEETPAGDLSAPRPLHESDDLASFDSGSDPLDRWLRERGIRNQASGDTRTFVVASGPTIVAFYTLSASVAAHAALTAVMRRNAPDPIPTLLLGRLAVSSRHARRGIGRHLVLDAARRTVLVAEHAGVRALMVNPKDAAAESFYAACGFKLMPRGQLTLMVLPIGQIRASLAV